MTNGASLYSACHQNMHPCQPPRIPRPELNSWWSSFHCRMMQIDAAEQLLAVWHQGTGLGIMVTPTHVSSVSLADIWRVYRGGEKFQ